jgi:hypothetical protein
MRSALCTPRPIFRVIPNPEGVRNIVEASHIRPGRGSDRDGAASAMRDAPFTTNIPRSPAIVPMLAPRRGRLGRNDSDS